MRIIDSDNYAASGIETFFFPGGEPHCKVPLYDEPVLLYLKLRTWTDVGFAACVMDVFNRRNDGSKAFIPYFPGARQDKYDAHTPATLYNMAFLLCMRNIFVFDPHSALLGQAVNARTFGLEDIYLPPQPCSDVRGVIAPDKGARVRAEAFAEAHCPGTVVYTCAKSRQFDSGSLLTFKLPPLMEEGHYIIVDDICDGGATFNMVAEAFANDPVGKHSTLELIVSHGIFSRGLQNIDPLIGHITTTDSWCRLKPTSRLTVIPLLPNLQERIVNA